MMATISTIANPTPQQLQSFLNTEGNASTMLDADQWNYYYSELSGVHQSADLFPTGNRTAVMTVSQYFANRAQAGLLAGGVAAPPTGAQQSLGTNPVTNGLAASNSSAPSSAPAPEPSSTQTPLQNASVGAPAATDFFSQPVLIPGFGSISTGTAIIGGIVLLVGLWFLLD